ncbi:MAG: prepilin-type N-terminal cleavage/methylation domain-containing protein [Candidatus Sumerlaeaceae bacterium]|nr:prepilin-type N-terminal cleavage/methylation domain-containing protein [Candidatus Sumerlaeaceae bacterium]
MVQGRLNIVKSMRSKGFTLVEMLIVAALIALFAGLAVINIQQQFELNKQKAATAECREIGTAMSFALNDLGFYPKICFLRFNYLTLTQEISTLPLNQFEYHGLTVGGITSRLQNQWSKAGAYAAFNFKKLALMQIPGSSRDPFEWPADPWNNPYVAYIVQAVQNGNTVENRFIKSAGETGNFFAGVVSYGRNRVPGLTDEPTGADINARNALRLYKDGAAFNTYIALTETEYDAAKAAMIFTSPPNPTPLTPRIRDNNSDDRVFEF